MTVVSYPIPAYSNPPIEADYYQPSRFVISAISLGETTTITTTVTHNYVVGQEVRLLIPWQYGANQLNNQKGIVLSIPSSTQVTLNINSSVGVNSFISSPFVSTITGATKANPCVLTSNNSFLIGAYIRITGVGGMTELNGNTYLITAANSTSITLNVNSTSFTTYTSGGTATFAGNTPVPPQIIAIGDVNSGIISQTGRVLTSTNIPGSFINIS